LRFLIANRQLEVGAFASSYIPTTSSQVTRAADIAVMQGVNFTDWYNQGEGTFFVESSSFGTNAPATGNCSLAVADGTTSNIITVNQFFGPEHRLGGVFTAGSSHIAVQPGPLTYPTGSKKTTFAFTNNQVSGCTNGQTVVTRSGAFTIPVVDRLSIGNITATGNSSQPLFGHIRRIAYWSTPLTIAEQQQLTQP
jgi:hypothetical protein